MRGRDVFALIILVFIGAMVGGIAFWFILQYLPLIVALILAFIVAFVIIVAISAFIEFFAAAVGALYYLLIKKPQIASGSMGIEDTRKIDKERGTFKREDADE